MILLVADMEEITANPDKRRRRGSCSRRKLDRARGVVATVLVQGRNAQGRRSVHCRLRPTGKVRAMFGRARAGALACLPDRRLPSRSWGSPNRARRRAIGSRPLADEAKARQIAAFRQEKIRAETAASKSSRRTLESLSQDIGEPARPRSCRSCSRATSQGSARGPAEERWTELPVGQGSRRRASVGSIGAISPGGRPVGRGVQCDHRRVQRSARIKAATEDLAKRKKRSSCRMYTVIYDLRQRHQASDGRFARADVQGKRCWDRPRFVELFHVPKVGTDRRMPT